MGVRMGVRGEESVDTQRIWERKEDVAASLRCGDREERTALMLTSGDAGEDDPLTLCSGEFDREEELAVTPRGEEAMGGFDTRGAEDGARRGGEHSIGGRDGAFAPPCTPLETDCGVEMEDGLWGNLSEELLPIILAKLPLRSLAQFRCVCKTWSSLWLSNSFHQLRSSVPAERPWFIFNNYNHDYRLLDGCFSYNISSNKWHKLAFKLPSQIERVAASAGGLLFCVSRPSIMVSVWRCMPRYLWPEMFVCNPLNNSWIKLAQRPGHWQPIIVGMVADSANKSYKLILADRHQGTEIYDSGTRSWKLLSRCPTTVFLRTNNSVSIEGKLVITGAISLIVFDTKEETWSKINYPVGCMSHPQISTCQGRILLVGLLRNGYRLEVWRIDRLDGTTQWHQVYSSMLEDFSPVCMGTEESAHFLAHSEPEDLLCYARFFSARTVFDSYLDHQHLYEKFVGKVLFFSVSQNSWCLVDKRHVDVKSIGESFRFDPRVDAVA